jgi:multidrug efflux pump subunit AcrB
MIKLSLRNPHLMLVGALIAVVLGVASYGRLPADLLPIFDTPAVQIVTFYPGMPPEVMERDIMSRLERWTGQSVGIEHQEAKAMLGVSVVKDFFREDISLDTAMAQVTSYAMSDMFYLPPGTIPPMIMPFDPTAALPLCLVSVSSPTMSEKELYDVAYYELRNRLQSIPGVIAPAVYGGKLRRILAYVDPAKLEAHKLAPLDVVNMLHTQNVFIPAGDIKIGNFDYQIFTNSMPEKIDEINDFPVKVVREGKGAAAVDKIVYMRDVGEVKDSSQIQSNIVRINGRRQVYIPIYRQPGANTINIVNSIRGKLSNILQRLRDMDERAGDLALEVVLDQSVYVRKSVDGLKFAGLLGALLAGLVVALFLRSLKTTFIVVVAIPIAVLAAIVGLYYSGQSLNAMTLGGLALAIGILVDQSIVVIENIVRHLDMGKTPAAAAHDGAAEVAMPVLVSTITFIVVFYPVVFLSGMAKFLFTPLALSATFAILASYLVSITLLPAYCAAFLKQREIPQTQANRTRQRRDTVDYDAPSVPNAKPPIPAGEVLAPVRRATTKHVVEDDDPRVGAMVRKDESQVIDLAQPTAYSRTLRKLIKARWVVLAVSVAGLGGAALLAMNIGQELFPRVDAGQFRIQVRTQSGTRIEQTERVVKEVEKVIIAHLGTADPEYPKVENHPDSDLRLLISNLGVLMDWPAAYTSNNGPMDAFMLAQLKGKPDSPSTFEHVQALRRKLNAQFPDVEFSFDTGGMLSAALNFGEPAPIHVQVVGSKLKMSHEIAKEVQREVASVAGTNDVVIKQRIDYPTLQVEIDRVKAAQLGLTADDVVKALVTATNSSINFKPAFWLSPKNGNHYFIGAQYSEKKMVNIDTLLDVGLVSDKTKKPVRVRNVATIHRGVGPAVINHHNITRVVDVYANVQSGRDIGSVMRAIEERLQGSTNLLLTPRVGVDEFEVNGPKYKGRGYAVRVMGEVKTMRDSFSQFAGGLGLAVILVFLVMVAQFRSFVDPLIVLVAVPLGFIGVILMLLATDTWLSIQSGMGIIMVVGIVVEYSIVLVDFANHRLAEGQTPINAVVDAAQVRLRPILMTSMTTLLALVPMALGIGGGEANIPMARAIIGGVLGATVLTLLVVPCLYAIVKRDKPKAVTSEVIA